MKSNIVCMLKKKFGKPPRIFRSDQGGEYDNKKVKEIFMNEGIQHQLTVPYTRRKWSFRTKKSLFARDGNMYAG